MQRTRVSRSRRIIDGGALHGPPCPHPPGKGRQRDDQQPQGRRHRSWRLALLDVRLPRKVHPVRPTTPHAAFTSARSVGRRWFPTGLPTGASSGVVAQGLARAGPQGARRHAAGHVRRGVASKSAGSPGSGPTTAPVPPRNAPAGFAGVPASCALFLGADRVRTAARRRERTARDRGKTRRRASAARAGTSPSSCGRRR